MDEPRDGAIPTPALGRFDMHLSRHPQLLGCERLPFLVLLGTVAFLVIVLFGITLRGLLGGGLMLAGGILWLRYLAQIDPLWFAVRRARMAYPVDMPDIPPDPRLGTWAFVGCQDPPPLDRVLRAWGAVAVVISVPSAGVALFAGPGAGAATFVAVMLAVALLAFTMPKDPADDP
ncbi:hypothetical protein [Tateyamaria sp.]|uniref:hypothetical protein n=1 Tax=Tateyamaria sp. TaxID=1929288 RepID=UPI003B223023